MLWAKSFLALIAVAVAATVAASAGLQRNDQPFVLFGSWPLVGHTVPLIYTAAELAKLHVASRIVVATTGIQGGTHNEVARIVEGLKGSGVEYVQVGHVDVDKDSLVNFDAVVNGKTSNGGISVAEHTLCVHSKPFYDGLMASEFAKPGNTPDVVVCDFASSGCHEFAVAVGAVLVINQPDVIQMISWRWSDWTVPLIDVDGDYPTREAARKLFEVHNSRSVSGLLSRLWHRVIAIVLYYGVPVAAAQVQERCWPDRPAFLPGQLGFVQEDASYLILQNTFFPFEAPANLLPHFHLTGPILAPDVMLMAANPASRNRTLDIDDVMREWLERDVPTTNAAAHKKFGFTPVVYISQGTLFAIKDARRVLAVCNGLLAAGVRVIFKTSFFDSVASITEQAGLVPPPQPGSRSTSSDRLMVTKWVSSQLDVLSHPRVVLFFSHCGTNSVFEAAAIGTPMVCLPVMPSQVVTGVNLLRTGAMAAMFNRHSPTLAQDITAGILESLRDYDDIQAARASLVRHMVHAGGAKNAAREIALIAASGSTSYHTQQDYNPIISDGFDVHVIGVLAAGFWVLVTWRCFKCCFRRGTPTLKPKSE